MYLHLFHGRTSPEQRLESWGTDGPWIGPLKAVHTTYAHTIKLVFCHAEDAAKFGLDIERPWFHVRECMLVHMEIFYGEWAIERCDVAQPAHAASIDPSLPTPDEPDDAWIDSALMAAYEGRSELSADEVCYG